MKPTRRPSAFAIALYAIVTGSFATSGGLLFAASVATPQPIQAAWLTMTGALVVVAGSAGPFVLFGIDRVRRRRPSRAPR